MSSPESLPAPRVMGVKKFAKRFHHHFDEHPKDDALVQMWAVAHGHDEAGNDVLLVALSIIGEGDEPFDHQPMKKSTFENLMPLSLLAHCPDDPSVVATLGPGPVEGPVTRTGLGAVKTRVGVSSEEAFELCEKWMSGRRPVRRTLSLFRQVLGLIPEPMAEAFISAYQLVETKSFEHGSNPQVAAICFAIGTVLQAREEA